MGEFSTVAARLLDHGYFASMVDLACRKARVHPSEVVERISVNGAIDTITLSVVYKPTGKSTEKLYDKPTLLAVDEPGEIVDDFVDHVATWLVMVAI